MKIIFDSKEQRDKFMKLINSIQDESESVCPERFGLERTGCLKYNNCAECWKASGIELIVPEQLDNFIKTEIMIRAKDKGCKPNGDIIKYDNKYYFVNIEKEIVKFICNVPK